MFEKFQKAMDSVDDIKKAKQEIESAKKEIKDSSKKMSELVLSIENDSKEHKNKLSDELSEVIGLKQKLLELCDTFEREIKEFRIKKNKLDNDIIIKVSSDIKKELNTYIMGIRDKIEILNTATEDIAKITSTTKSSIENIEKLNSISSNIKKEDFELSRHANELRKNDKEKLELMKKVDNLQRMVAKQRRTGRNHT